MEDLFFAVKLARQKLSKYYAEVTPMTGMLVISAHILDPVRKLRSFGVWEKGMDINPEDKTSDTTPYQEPFLQYRETGYCAKHWRVPVIKHGSFPSSNLIPAATVLESCQWSFDPYDLSSNHDEYLMPNNVGEATPGRRDRAARVLTAARLYFSSPPDAPNNWGRINPNLNDYHSDPMEICSTLLVPDITDWWRQHEETHSM